MFELVSTGGGANAVRRAARSLVAAYLNASHDGVDYAFTTSQLEAKWDAAVAEDSDQAFQDLHAELDEQNNLGCDIG